MRSGTDLNGVVCATVTPLDAGGRIDVGLLAAHCGRMLAAGCRYVSAFGTTGEGASFSVREKVDALDAMAQRGVDMSQHIPGVMATSVDDAAALYSAASRLGCRAALIIPPYYYAPTPQGVADFYAAVIAAAGAPATDIILYNFPAFSGVTFTPELVRIVAAQCGGRVAGIKDSTGDLAGGIALINAFPELSIFTGDDRILSRMVAAGGAGMIGGMSNLYAEDCVRLFSGSASDDIQILAKQRIEAVDGNGGLIMLKALLAARNTNDGFGRVAPPLCAAQPGLVADVVGLLAGTQAAHS